MNITAQLARDPQAHLPTGPTHVASRSARTAAPGAWTPTDRWAWPCGLPVSGIARAVAGCIARHANDKTGLGWPGMGTIATETGFCRRAVVKAVKELERGGHVTINRFKVGKKNKANRYQLPPMGGAPAALGGGGGSAPRALGGSAPRAPESVSIESVKKRTSAARARCSTCKRTWPANRGTECYRCGPESSTRLQADETPTGEPTACTCGDAYHNSYGRRCIDCGGEASAAQREAAHRPAQVASTPTIAEAETETRPPPDGGELGPAKLRFKAEFAKWTVGKRTPAKHRSDRRRMGRTARKEMANLTKGDA